MQPPQRMSSASSALAGPLLEFDMMADNIIWLDFNDAPEQRDETTSDTDALRALACWIDLRLSSITCFRRGASGVASSTSVMSMATRARVWWLSWTDHGAACGKTSPPMRGGDIIDLWARSQGRSARSDFHVSPQRSGGGSALLPGWHADAP